MSDTIMADDAPHILLVDDDSRIRALLTRFLMKEGYRVSAAEDAAQARTRMEQLQFDLLILDVMMPGESGLDLARAVRGRDNVPIIMLTARGDAEDRVAGLETGADDYLPKPFEPRELVLRIQSILRRAGMAAVSTAQDVCFGPFRFDARRGELRQGDEVVRLTERERDLLKTLVARGGETVSRLALAGSSGANERAVDVQINRLRRKIEADPAAPLYLQTVRGIGYRLVID